MLQLPWSRLNIILGISILWNVDSALAQSLERPSWHPRASPGSRNRHQVENIVEEDTYSQGTSYKSFQSLCQTHGCDGKKKSYHKMYDRRPIFHRRPSNII
ncbi:hypothetical protein CYMTET_46949 [Cymbomonas tetramitiformis]|uniref:Uncharacterized protein n=1 Tax=Cymbomonas tetramitiformis TaxID=36881 RepID=A0AAE0EWM0_9CHLO|nr:hypothetical protein CYMTET_46949 [Cymbomonas tetramitiformis]